MTPINVVSLWLHRGMVFFERPRYVIRGSCLRCGHCCRHLMIVEAPFFTNSLLRRMSHWWLESVYPFVITGNCVEYEEEGEHYRILNCRNAQNGMCAEYALRPRLCREWPLDNDAHPPVLFVGCGYRVIDRKGHADVDVSVRRTPAPQGYAAMLEQGWRARQNKKA